MRVSLPSLGLLLALAALPVAFAACSGSSSGGAGATPDGGGEAATGADRHVVVLFTSDEHSHYFGFSPELDDYPIATAAGSGPLVGGVARRATVIKGLRKAADDAGKDSILVSSGDNQMGCLPMLGFSTASIDYGTMQALGYDATALGNHEFDFGPKALAASINAAVGKMAAPPIIASNIHFSSTDPGDDDLAALYGTGAGDKPVEPYRVLTTKSGVKVGLLGIVGINAAHVAPNKTPVAFSAPVGAMDGDLPTNLPALYKDLQPVVDHLRNDLKVDLVVALSHSGIADVTTPDGIAAGEDTAICQNVDGIDLIVSGHAHQHDPKPMQQMNTSTMRPCLVLNGGAFGQEVGTVEFTILGSAAQGTPGTGLPTWDMASQKMVPVNEMVVPDATLAAQADGVISQSEAANASGTTLAGILGHALGMTLKDDTSKAGDLYFMKVGATDFDLTDPNARIWLSADAMLEEADALVTELGLPATTVAVESQGVIRQIIAKGKTGAIAATDAFNVVPLGASPADGSLGYPLVRAFVTLTELRGVLELSLSAGAKNSDYNLGLAGASYEYDTTRPPVAKGSDLLDPKKGMVTKISFDSNHADGYEQYDIAAYTNGVTSNFDSTLIPVITSSYIAQFAGDAGVKIKDSTGAPIAIKDAIIKRKDGTEVKQVEAFIRAIHAVPKLPSTYDTSSPSYTKRKICVKGC